VSIDGGSRRSRSTSVLLLLLIPQEIDNKFLILFDEIIRESLVIQVLAIILSPARIEGVEEGKIGRFPINAAR
jgi:hypothetical protein